jgi:hypothetical protein
MQQHRWLGTVFDAPKGCLRLHQPPLANCRQTRPSAPVIFILDDSVGLFAKRIEIMPGTTPQMLRISPKIQPQAVTNGGLMRYISSGVWYDLPFAFN